MTGEGSPPGAGGSPGAQPDLRASDQDRDRVVEILREAAAEGRLTTTELGERVEAALAARIGSDLAMLVADLPAASGNSGQTTSPAKDVVRIDYGGARTTRSGRWAVPARMEIRAAGGTVKLDLTNAVITQPYLDMDADVRGGALVLVTRPGIEVDTDELAVRGGTVRVRPRNGWIEPVQLQVEISGENRGGRVVVRPPRRTFLQWLARRPRQYASSMRD
ncbi:MAG TPA: DUF1707 domain-containing protein [Streptosporangiaceae bacterium]|nr:DUF1707 domain-containing protein [Streptosporangiaceae bacterium]